MSVKTVLANGDISLGDGGPFSVSTCTIQLPSGISGNLTVKSRLKKVNAGDTANTALAKAYTTSAAPTTPVTTALSAAGLVSVQCGALEEVILTQASWATAYDIDYTWGPG